MGYLDAALTEEQIDERAEARSTTNQGYKIVANRIMREQTGVALVNRAIRKVRKLENANGAIEGLEYVTVVMGMVDAIYRGDEHAGKDVWF